ncbi:MBL fold metallo-hydrolase [Rhizobium mayense]|uniref:MBL fold metallo-hydrolase n=1 Tax=Rhizobium mayense TaxID=1312184 RepID=UPI00398C626C
MIDPYFAPRHSLPSFTGRSPNPMTELPRSIDDILQGVELVIVSHLHTDHFDAVAKERVPKTLPILCQPVTKDVSATLASQMSPRLRNRSLGKG